MSPLDRRGFTEDDIKHVKTSWETIYKNKEENALLLFQTLFEMYPDYEKYFIRFKKGGQASLFDNPEFKKHMTENVMNSLNAIVENLDKDEKLKEILNTIATNHSKRNIKKEQYENLGKVILEVVKRGLKESYTSELETSWTKIITSAMEQMGNLAGEK